MYERDAVWAVQQYEAVRSILPKAKMPAQSTHAKNLGEIADLFDIFLLDAFGVLNLGDTAIAGAVQRVEFLKNRGKRVLVLTNGASGKWSVMHPSMFAFISVTIGTYMGMLAGTARTISDGNQMDAIAGPLVMLLVLISYFRLRPEGMEDGMTFQGEEVESAWFTNGLLTFALIMGALFAVTSIFWENVG